MRLLFVGDSMTIGRTGETTWRHRMARHLRDCPTCPGPGGAGGPGGTGGPVTVVGPWAHQYDDGEHTGSGARTGTGTGAGTSTGGEDGSGRHAHLAAWGEGWLHMASRIGGAVSEHRPDVLLVALGLIDLGFYTDSAQTDANVRRFFAEARAVAPRIRAVVLPVVPNIRAATDGPFATEVGRFNDQLGRTLASLALPRSPLTLAPAPTSPPFAYDIHRDTYDGTHPTPSGATRLAAAFVHALHSPAAAATTAPPAPASTADTAAPAAVSPADSRPHA